MEGSIGLRKGAWCREEDDLLKACVERYGEGKWHLVPIRAGLNRCRKSCRLRWLNYLKPNIKRGEFSEDEVDLMIRMHRLLGNRWSLIAGRIPGRTANDVKNYWNTKVVRTKNNKHPSSFQKEDTNNDNNMIPKPKEATTASATNTHQVIKPHPRTFSRTKHVIATSVNACAIASSSTSNNKSSFCFWDDDCNNNSNNEWWGNLLLKDKNGGKLENDMFDNEQDNWEGFFTDPTATWNDVVIKGGDGDLLIRTPTWDSDLHLLDANLWDYS